MVEQSLNGAAIGEAADRGSQGTNRTNEHRFPNHGMKIYEGYGEATHWPRLQIRYDGPQNKTLTNLGFLLYINSISLLLIFPFLGSTVHLSQIDLNTRDHKIVIYRLKKYRSVSASQNRWCRAAVPRC